MKQEKIWDEYAALSPELQRQVADFIAFLRTRPAHPAPTKHLRRKPLRDEAFIGMWRGRKEMQDSTAWMRKTRQNEWGS